MKQLPLYLLMIPLLVTMIGAPALVSAKQGDDDRYESRDDRDNDDDRNEDDDSDDTSTSSLEIEADVYTDITIVKVENRAGAKSTFSTTLDTRAEIVAEVVSRFGYTAAEVEAGLDLEVEDRASRAKDRAKISGQNNAGGNGWYSTSTKSTVCRDDDRRLQIEADVFTDTTIVKVEFVNAKDEVFTTSATTSAGVVSAVAARYSTLSTSSIEAALDFEVEDRASRDSDKVVDTECRSGSAVTGTPNTSTETRLAEFRARIAELQTLLDRMISLLRGN
jgi:hypothetical protein